MVKKKKRLKQKKTDRKMTYQDLTQEQKERYNAYHKEYLKYYRDAQSDEERNEIVRKLEELCQAEFGVPSNSWWWFVESKLNERGNYNYLLPYPNKEQQNKPTQDIKSLKIVVMILAAIVIYLLARR